MQRESERERFIGLLFQIYATSQQVRVPAVNLFLSGTIILLHVAAGLLLTVAVRAMETDFQQSKNARQSVYIMTPFFQKIILQRPISVRLYLMFYVLLNA